MLEIADGDRVARTILTWLRPGLKANCAKMAGVAADAGGKGQAPPGGAAAGRAMDPFTWAAAAGPTWPKHDAGHRHANEAVS